MKLNAGSLLHDLRGTVSRGLTVHYIVASEIRVVNSKVWKLEKIYLGLWKNFAGFECTKQTGGARNWFRAGVLEHTSDAPQVQPSAGSRRQSADSAVENLNL